jgi:hypothetical protein
VSHRTVSGAHRTVRCASGATTTSRATVICNRIRCATVADALSRKSQVNLMIARPMPYELAKEFDRLSLGFLNNSRGVTVELEPTLEREIKEAQKNDEKISEIR